MTSRSARKERSLAQTAAEAGWFTDHLTTRTPPDYQDRNLELGLRPDLLPSTARALFVHDWIDTGGQAVAARKLVDAAAATWCRASVIVDALENPRLRRDLDVKCLLRITDL